jgi:hypothetical protein
VIGVLATRTAEFARRTWWPAERSVWSLLDVVDRCLEEP